MNNYIEIILILLVTTFSGSAGALALKKGMNKLSQLSVATVLKNLWVYLGASLYILSAVTNILLLKKLDYSIAFPMTSLTYVWTVIISYFTFNERLSIRKIVAVCLLILGVFIISQ